MQVGNMSCSEQHYSFYIAAAKSCTFTNVFIPSPHESGLSCLAIAYYVEYLAHPSPPIYNVWLGKCSFQSESKGHL